MGFMDKARAAANELAAKADTALAESGLGGPGTTAGQADRLLRDLGVLAYLEASGRPVPEGERERVVAALRDAEQRGALPNLTVQTGASARGGFPPPPGSAGRQSPPPPGPAGTPPSGSQTGTPPSAGPAGHVPPTAAPPPPPSWAKGEPQG